jgi:hypothetical protein
MKTTKPQMTVEVRKTTSGRYEVQLLVPERGGSISAAGKGMFDTFEAAWTEAKRIAELWGGIHAYFRQ